MLLDSESVDVDRRGRENTVGLEQPYASRVGGEAVSTGSAKSDFMDLRWYRRDGLVIAGRCRMRFQRRERRSVTVSQLKVSNAISGRRLNGQVLRPHAGSVTYATDVP